MRVGLLLSFACLWASLTATHALIHRALTSQQQITHVFFLEDQLFYISKTGRQFGFATRHSGQVITPHQLAQNEATIKINRREKNIVMRKNRNEVFLLNLTIHLIDELHVELSFKNQFISDAVFREKETIVMTRQDIRVYAKGMSTADDPGKVFNSVRKGEVFKKIFIEEEQPVDHLLLVLVSKEQLCIRNFRTNLKGVDQCLFRSEEQIKAIHKTDDFLVIERKSETFVVASNLETIFKYTGTSRQVHRNLVILQDLMTYSLDARLFIQGMAVASTSERQLWLRKGQKGQIQVQEQGQIIGEISSEELPLRSWMQTCKKDCDFELIVQYPQNFLVLYEHRPGHEPPFSRRWPTTSQFEKHLKKRAQKKAGEGLSQDL